MHTERLAWFNFLTVKDVFSLYLVSIKLREYQNLQDFLCPRKNNNISGYIQSTLSISLKIEPIEMKENMIVFQLPGSER